MKLGIIAGGYAPVDLSRATKRDLKYVEFCTNHDHESEALIANYDNIKAELEKTGISVASVGRWNSAPNTANGVDKNVIELHKRLIDTAADLGSPVYTCGCNYVDEISLFKNYSNAVEFFGTVSEYAKSKGLKTAVYNCDWNNFVYSPREWEVILGELPELCLKYDPSHSYYRGHYIYKKEVYKDEIYNWIGRFAHMHLKGAVAVNGNHVDDSPAGLDCIDWNFVLSSLYDAEYDGVLSIEPHSSTWKGELGEKGIDFTVKYFRERLFK